MFTHYLNKAFEILREEGPVELFKASVRFVLNEIDPHGFRRFKYYTFKNYLLNRVQYEAPPDPYEPIIVDTNDIKYWLLYDMTKNRLYSLPKWGGLGQIKTGKWDMKKYHNPVDENTKILGFHQRFVERKDWRETEYMKHLEGKIDKEYHKKSGFETPEEYFGFCFNKYEDLYENIKNNGYKKSHRGKSIRSPRDYVGLRDKLEVLVVIDRNGDIHLSRGFHRFAIARCLELEIPVQVICRHKKWQELRDEIHINGLPEEYNNLRRHPDLQDILN